MGLDWMLNKRKPKPGFEKEFELVNKQYNDAADEKAEEGAEKRLDEISESAYAVIGSPRVGIDEEATRWFKEKIYEPNYERAKEEQARVVKTENTWDRRNVEFIAHWLRPFEEVLKDSTGNWVPDLAKSKEGHATITGMMTSPIDFRGKVIGRLDWLSEHSQNEAYEDHSAEDAILYADRLEEELNEHLKAKPDALKDEESDARYVRDAVSWLRFWGKNGFGFHAWY